MNVKRQLQRSRWCRIIAALAAAAVVGLACESGSGPPDLGALVFDITIHCAPLIDPPYVCQPLRESVRQGETMTIGLILVDTSAARSAQVRVRPICWQNIAIYRGDLLVDYLPRVSTCPDSTLPQGDNFPSVFNLRFFSFPVPDVWTPDTYTAKALILVDPPATVSRSFVVR